MCIFGSDEPEPFVPDSPPDVLTQESPKKKTANTNKANSLSIGSKRYRSSPTDTSNAGYPSVT